MNTNPAYDLFNLMLNLTRLHNKDKIIELFIEGMQEIFAPVSFGYSLSAEQNAGILYEMKTGKSHFGLITTKGPLPSEKELRVLIEKSIQMLAVNLEHLDYEQTLEIERNEYEAKADKSFEELKKTVKDLQESRTASINLIEDLSDEVEKRREAEKELLLKNLAFDESIVANSIADMQGVIKQANASFLKTWDFISEEEVVGRPISDFFKYENEVTEIMKSLDQTGQWDGEVIALKKDGSSFSATGLATVIRDKNGELIGYQSSVQDITDRKNADLALRESEKRFRSLYENVTIGIYRTTPEGQILMANPALVKMLGFDSLEQLKVRNLTVEGYEPDYPRSKFLETIEKSGKIQGLESAWRQKNGNTLHIRENANAVQDDNGRILYIDGTVEDISERKKTEEALRESEDKFKYIFEHSALGNSITDASGKTHFNNAFCEMLGYKAKELENLKWQDFTHPDDFEITQKVVDSLISQETDSPRFIKRYLRKDGSIMWADVSTSLRYDTDNKPVYFMTTINDITELKLAEEILRNDEKRFRELIEALPQLYWTCRVDGPCDYLSKQWIEYTGIPESEQLGYGWLKQIHPDDKEKTISDWNEKVKTGNIFDIEFRIRRYDAEYHWFKTRAVPIHNADKQILRWLGSNTDIDSIRKAEDQLKNYNDELEQKVVMRTKQLQAANKELEAFSYSVSHDLRAPLRAIHSFTSILRQDYEKILDEEGNRICSIIETSSIHMGKLIDDLLAFSRFGRTGLDYIKINMEQLARAVYSEMTIPAEQKRITFIVEKLPSASGDTVMMRQVFTNLISNAIKYSSKKENARIVIGSESSDNEVIYYVKDDGVGFDMQYSNKLFGVFQRLHSAKEFEGNGVGLAIVQRIILRHDGRVWAEGEKGIGATFYFALPVKQEQSN